MSEILVLTWVPYDGPNCDQEACGLPLSELPVTDLSEMSMAAGHEVDIDWGTCLGCDAPERVDRLGHAFEIASQALMLTGELRSSARTVFCRLAPHWEGTIGQLVNVANGIAA